MEPSRRAFLTSAAAVVGTALVAGCGDDDDDGVAAPSSEATPSTETSDVDRPLDLPKNDEAELKAFFAPFFAPLDQHVTRVGLFDLAAGFVRDDRGTHMAIYVEPIDPQAVGWDDDRYIDTVAPGMAAITPTIFQMWADLQTMDLCQEPPQAAFPEEEPPIETQVFLGRADSAAIDWTTADLASLFVARLRAPDRVRVSARPGIEQHDRWQAAQAEALARIDAGG